MVLSTIAVVTLVNALVIQLAKKVKWIKKSGEWGIQGLVILFSFLIAAVQYGWQFMPEQIVTAVYSIAAGTLVWYELVIKKFTSKN